MSDLTFTTAARRAAGKKIKFTLDDHTYTFTPPKRVAIWLAADEPMHEQVRISLNWLSAGLSEEESQRITDRLMDFDDPLDIDTLLAVVNGLIEEAAGRPTGPSPD